MDFPDAPTYEYAECEALFQSLFSLGFAGRDVMEELSPQGWAASPLNQVFHPSVERVYEESVLWHRNIESLAGSKETRPPRPDPTLEEIRSSHEETPLEPKRELGELVGLCLPTRVQPSVPTSDIYLKGLIHTHKH